MEERPCRQEAALCESTVTAKGQTTSPEHVRDLPGLEPGDRIRSLATGDAVRILRPRKAMSLCGALNREGLPVTLGLLDAEAIVVEAAEDAVVAVEALGAAMADFADPMIVAAGRRSRGETLGAVDRRAARHDEALLVR